MNSRCHHLSITSKLLCGIIVLFSIVPSHAQELVPYLDSVKYGYADISGKVRIPVQFDEAEFFDEHHLAKVREGNSWYLMNSKGKKLFPISAKYRKMFEHVYTDDNGHDWEHNHGSDTLYHLLALRETPYAFRLYNYHTGNVSTLYDFRDEAGYHRSAPIHADFRHGFFTGRINDTLYHVLDESLDVILTSQSRPEIWSDSLITTTESNKVVANYIKSGRKYILPFHDISQPVDGKYFIVSKWVNNYHAEPGQRKQNRNSGIINLQGEPVIDFDYNSIWGGNGHVLIASKYNRQNKPDSTFFIDLQKKTIKLTPYKGIYGFHSGDLYRAQLADGKWTVLDRSGNRKSAFAYDTIFSDYKSYHYRIGNTAGLLDSNLNLVIEYEADFIRAAHVPGYYSISKNNKWGLINANGKEIIPPEYEAVFMYENPALIILHQNGKKGYARLDGTILFPAIYDELSYHGEGGVFFYTTGDNGLYTYYDKDLNIVRDSVRRNGLGIRSFYSDRVNGLHQILDRFGEPIGFPVPKVSYFEVDSDSTYYALLNKDDLLYVMRPDGTFITNDSLQLKNDHNKYCRPCGLFGVQQGKLQGVIDHQENWVIPLKDHEVINVSKYFIIIRQGREYYIFYTDGSLFNNESFTSITPNEKSKFWQVERNGKIGYINIESGEIVIPFIYQRGGPFMHTYAIVELANSPKDRQTMIIDTAGNIIVETNFDNLFPLSSDDKNSHYIAEYDNKFGIINIHGKVIIHPVYEKIESFIDTTFYKAYVGVNNWIIINQDNQLVLSADEIPESEEFIKLPNNYFVFVLKNHSIIVDKFGKVVKQIQSTQVDTVLDKKKNILLIEVQENGRTYYINAKTFVVYKK